MENQTRFDLNAAVENWRKELAAQRQLSFDNQRELEEHLANLMAEFCKKGMNEKEAFRLACLRIGSLRKLNKEFKKGRGHRWNFPRAMAACMAILFCCIWVWSYYAKHSAQYGRPNWNILVVTDHGILEFQLNRRDTKNDVRDASSWYNPRADFESGFEWDTYRRNVSIASGKACLKFQAPKTGFAGLWAKCGFVSCSQTVGQGFVFGSYFRSLKAFAPFWFLALMAVSPVLAKPLALQSIFVIRLFRTRLRGKGAHNLWKTKPALT